MNNKPRSVYARNFLISAPIALISVAVGLWCFYALNSYALWLLSFCVTLPTFLVALINGGHWSTYHEDQAIRKANIEKEQLYHDTMTGLAAKTGDEELIRRMEKYLKLRY